MEMTRKGEWCEIIVPAAWNGQSVQDILRDAFKLPKKTVHELRMDKGVKVNGEHPNWTTPLKEKDRLWLLIFGDEESDVVPEFDEIEVLYEDDHLLVVNKPCGIDTHHNEKGQTGTLMNRVAGYCLMNGWLSHTRPIHRLDKDTTGAIIFAKNRMAGVMLDRLLVERDIKRHYGALVHNVMNRKSGTVKELIGRDRHHPTRRRVSLNGLEAVTHFRVVSTLPESKMTVVSLQLDTGRTHQIRVHMSHIGHPLVGDVLYDGKNVAGYDRQALHAYKVEMTHPMTQEKLFIKAPFPEDMDQVSQKIRV